MKKKRPFVRINLAESEVNTIHSVLRGSDGHRQICCECTEAEMVVSAFLVVRMTSHVSVFVSLPDAIFHFSFKSVYKIQHCLHREYYKYNLV